MFKSLGNRYSNLIYTYCVVMVCVHVCLMHTTDGGVLIEN